MKESEGMVKGSLLFTYSVNILAQLIGPLPSVNSNMRPLLSFYSAGLIYRVIIAIPFWIGVYYLWKHKISILFPLLIFVLFEMSSLALILEGLELRKSLPHLPFVYIISFWFLDKFDLRLALINRQKVKNLINIFILIAFGIIIYWNFRF